MTKRWIGTTLLMVLVGLQTLMLWGCVPTVETVDETAGNASGAVPEVFRVGTAETRTITSEEAFLVVDRLIMEDDSTLEIPEELTWRVYAPEASFGKNVVIRGRGEDGAQGDNGRAGGHGPRSSPGGSGTEGGDGANGGDGAKIVMIVGLRNIGKVTFDVRGGAGGMGGRGGNGGKGGQGECGRDTDGGPGGTGGPGGHGGSGGTGGYVDIEYWPLVEGLDTLGLSVKVQGGKEGPLGPGGAGGQGGDGKDCNWPQRNRRSGPGGSGGTPGRAGDPGADGEFSSSLVSERIASGQAITTLRGWNEGK